MVLDSMAKGNSASRLPGIAIALFVIIVVALLGLVVVNHYSKPTTSPYEKNLGQFRTNSESEIANSPIFSRLMSWYPGEWSAPVSSTTNTGLGQFNGAQTNLTTTTKKPLVKHFEDKAYMESLGYKLDNNLAADGAGSSSWGYSMTSNDQTNVAIFSYSVSPSSNNPNQPLTFNCPCDVTLSVFVSNPTTEIEDESISNPKPAKTPSTHTSNLANPASQNCIAKGGTLTIRKNGVKAEYGLCNFEDDMSCEEWAMFNGNCPVGGVKTTGLTTIEQSYCAWVGGETLAVPDAKCTLPNGKVCTDKALYDGICSAN